jgi:glycogen(starch) synthase
MPAEDRLIAIGRLEPAKGFEDAIRALGIIVKSHPRAFLTIVGNGAELYSLQNLARLTGVANNVAFLGAVPHDDVLQEIAKASIVIVPSRAIEGFSLVAAEAAMLGRPVVATRVGGLPETVIDGKTGFIVPPESPDEIARAVVALLDNPETAHALARNARSHAITAFDISRFVGEMADLYQQITGNRERSQ